MERGNTKHGPARDDELAHALQGTLRGNRPNRADEVHDPEPPADDDDPALGRVERPEPPGPGTA